MIPGHMGTAGVWVPGQQRQRFFGKSCLEALGDRNFKTFASLPGQKTSACGNGLLDDFYQRRLQPWGEKGPEPAWSNVSDGGEETVSSQAHVVGLLVGMCDHRSWPQAKGGLKRVLVNVKTELELPAARPRPWNDYPTKHLKNDAQILKEKSEARRSASIKKVGDARRRWSEIVSDEDS